MSYGSKIKYIVPKMRNNLEAKLHVLKNTWRKIQCNY